ncbi:MAG TPA: HAMP domain-containing sensor histidine kinase [Acidimicrobiia bacterium]|nr:HAMP domain-containing sensor histidine kinase [Acidimicrobiia bacterium]
MRRPTRLGNHSPEIPTAEPAYRGRDRRAVPRDTNLPVGRMCVAVALIAITWGMVIALLHYAGVTEPRFTVPVVRLDVGASLLAAVTAVACFFRWRLEGTASAFWAGVAVLVLGASGFASTEITKGYLAAGMACSVVAVGVVAVWIRGVEVDAGLSVPKVGLRTSAGLVVAFAAIRFLVGRDLAVVPVSIVIGVALLAAAYAAYVTHTRDQWMVVVLVAYGLGYAAYPTLAVVDPLRTAAAASFHLLAMGMAAFGSTLLLHEAAARQRETAFRLRVERDEAKDRFAETLHEVRSTVTALEGGVRTFEPANDPAQALLSRALVAEIQRLRALVDDRPVSVNAEVETFWVSEVLEPMLTVCVAAGWVVSWDIPADLHAVGRSTDVAQMVHALLTNAHRHAPGSPINVVVARGDDFASIRVEDRGPGVELSQREKVFERGERGDATDIDGRGLGLHIARTIARSHGGNLWVEERPGGGAAFVMTVPTVTVLPSAVRDRTVSSTWKHPSTETDLRNAQ